MCLPELQKSTDESSVSDLEVVPEEPSDEDNVEFISDNESTSVSSFDNCSLNSWINEHSYDDISMSDDSDDEDDVQNDEDDSSVDEIPNIAIQGREDINNDDVNSDEEKDEDEIEEDEDEVVAAFIAASSERNRNHPPNLSVGNTLIGDFSFHPNTNVIALGLSNGDIAMYNYSNEVNEHLRTNDNVHLKKVIVLDFNETGDNIYSVCKDNNVSVSDTETGKMKVYFEKGHRDGCSVASLCPIDENIFATGDEDGIVKIWDIRANGCRFSLNKTEECISSMISIDNSNNQPNLIYVASDGTLTVIDLSSNKMIIQSEPYKSLLTSCVTMKRKTKVVCGTGEGSLITFNMGDFSMFNDEFPCVDKGTAVNKLVPVTENIVISALDNGKIRATHLFPNCHLGIVGHHQEMSVDLMDISDNGHLIASTSYFSNVVKFWNIGFFEDFDVKAHFKKINPKEFNLPSSNVVNATDFFAGL